MFSSRSPQLMTKLFVYTSLYDYLYNMKSFHKVLLLLLIFQLLYFPHPPLLHPLSLLIDSKKVGHFLITIQKSFKLIMDQSWMWNGNSDENGCIFKFSLRTVFFFKKKFLWENYVWSWQNVLQLRTVLMRLFGYPYNNDLVICKDSPDYLPFSHFHHNYTLAMSCNVIMWHWKLVMNYQ